MSDVNEVLEYARLLDQAGMLDTRLLVERARWSERLIHEAIDQNLEAYFFSDGASGVASRGPEIAVALHAALAMLVNDAASAAPENLSKGLPKAAG